MRAIEQTGFGGIDMLALSERTEPALDQPNAVRVALSAAGISRWDLHRCRGLFGGGHPSFVAGYQGCGRVEAVGPLVRTLRPGDRVWWSASDGVSLNGTWADFRVVDADQLACVPDEVGTIVAAVAPLALATSMLALECATHRARPRRVLVHDAATDAGYLLVQLALMATMQVAALVRDELEQDLLRDAGVEQVQIDDSLDGAAAIEDWSEGVGCDVLFCCGDPARAVDWFEQLRNGGRVIVCAPGEPVGAWRLLCERGLSLQTINPLAAQQEAQQKRLQLLQDGGELLASSRLELPVIATTDMAAAIDRILRLDAENSADTLVLLNQ